MANQTSTTCRLRIELSVETSTPPFFGRQQVTERWALCKGRFDAGMAPPCQTDGVPSSTQPVGWIARIFHPLSADLETITIAFKTSHVVNRICDRFTRHGVLRNGEVNVEQAISI